MMRRNESCATSMYITRNPRSHPVDEMSKPNDCIKSQFVLYLPTPSVWSPIISDGFPSQGWNSIFFSRSNKKGFKSFWLAATVGGRKKEKTDMMVRKKADALLLFSSFVPIHHHTTALFADLLVLLLTVMQLASFSSHHSFARTYPHYFLRFFIFMEMTEDWDIKKWERSKLKGTVNTYHTIHSSRIL